MTSIIAHIYHIIGERSDYICRPCRRTVERRIDSLLKSELWIATSDSSSELFGKLINTHNPAIVYSPIHVHATENYDASTLKVYASILITQVLGNLTHAQTDCTRPFPPPPPPPQKMAWVKRLDLLKMIKYHQRRKVANVLLLVSFFLIYSLAIDFRSSLSHIHVS